jgi:hypothetical protein
VQKRWLTFLTFGLGAPVMALACGLTSPDIEVVATPVTLPEPISTPGETAASPDPTATSVIESPATPAIEIASDHADVYAERTLNGLTLHYADTETDKELAAVPIPSTRVMMAGEALFFEGDDGTPVRASVNGQHIRYEVAAPREEGDFYEFLISADGSTIVWLEARFGQESNPTTIWAAWEFRDAILPIYQEDVPTGITLRLASISEDGVILYFDRREKAVSGYSAFPSQTDLWTLGVNSGQTTHLPGEPGCGGPYFCDGRISDDGRYLLRTMHPASGEEEPIVVYDIARGQVVESFAAQPVNEDAAYEIGYPTLAPGARYLVYTLAEGPAGEEVFSYFRANLISGEQQLLAESGTTLLQPVRWLDGETLILSAKPAAYDEWHLNLANGELRRVSDRLYLGQVLLP